ncbi:MAG: M81 family metallopeptidase, partial [Proteobacteria bacterium]|nr:M81 family metallopeptidase [Pseudomonadota bacterium]
MTRILIAGFQHETNTFGATKASFEDFLEADGWPGLLRGNEVITGTEGINLPLTGFVDAVRSEPDIELIPVVWASAEPSAHVTDDAFERISAMILEGIRQAGSLDGIYLDLHGAMVTESHEDGEGELLGRIRDLTGDSLPVVVSLDLHANVTERMMAHASAFCIFRTYPHIDMAETGARCYPILRRLLSGETLYHAMRQASFLVPLSAQYTGASPCQELYQLLPRKSGPGQALCDIAMGFPPADI